MSCDPKPGAPDHWIYEHFQAIERALLALIEAVEALPGFDVDFLARLEGAAVPLRKVQPEPRSG